MIERRTFRCKPRLADEIAILLIIDCNIGVSFSA